MGKEMATRTLFYRCARGLDAQSVDHWHLIRRDDLSCLVEHSWSHYGGPDNSDVRTETLSSGQFIVAVEDMGALKIFAAARAHDVGKLSRH